MIIDSSSLIIFGKLNKIDILLKLFDAIEITDGVYKEAILEGVKRNFEDSFILKSYFDNNQIKIIKLKDKYLRLAEKLQLLNNIGIGESETIALAKQLDQKEVVIDESLAREAAKSMMLKPIGSLRVLLIAYEKKLLTEKEIKEIINKMIKLKFRISASTLIRFWELFKRIER